MLFILHLLIFTQKVSAIEKTIAETFACKFLSYITFSYHLPYHTDTV